MKNNYQVNKINLIMIKINNKKKIKKNKKKKMNLI